MKKTNIFRMFCLFVLFGVLVAACGGGGDDQLVLEEAPATEEIQQEPLPSPTMNIPVATVVNPAVLATATQIPLPTATLAVTPEIAQGVEEVPLQQMFNASAFQPTSGVFPVVEVIAADPSWAAPGFAIPWPEHNLRPDGRQQAPMINGEKVWHGFEIRPGDAIIFVSDGISTDAGSFTEPNGGWFRNNTAHQLTVYVQFGEVVIMDAPNDEATMDAMARTMLKFVVSTNGLSEASYLGEIPLQ